MPSDKKSDAVATAVESFRKSVVEQYELDESFVDDICAKFEAAVQPLAEAAAAPKRRGGGANKPKKARKKSAYNVFVREMMKTDEIQNLNHKEKMGAIAEKWKTLKDDDKTPYVEMASAENDAAVPPAEETA